MSPKITYDDFEIEVRSIGKSRYEARVLKSPWGRVGSKFVPPYTVDELERLLAALESGVVRSSPAARDLGWEDSGSEPMEPVAVAEMGRRLFQSLFPREVERCFRESRGMVRGRSGEGRGGGLRLRVTFDRGEDFSRLATVPWEFLWDEGQFFNRSRCTPVVRSLNVPEPAAAGVIDAPLRVVLIPSNPRDVRSLKTEYEARLVTEVLKRNPGIEAVTLRHLRIEELRRRLLDEPCHVLHFMGHGDFRQSGEDNFVLLFEGEDGRSEPVKSLQFAEYLQDIPGLRLVVLNSCWSGAFPRQGGQDPFTGVAAALVARGIPAVVAMQFPISDDAAIAFSSAFYDRIAAGDPVSAAVTEGRLAIKEPESFEWGTPVVFLAGEDRGFEVRPADGGAPSVVPASPAPLKLAIRSFWNPFIAETEPDDVLDLSEFFEPPKGRHIKEFSLWREEVFPRLEEFLLRHARARRPIVFDFAAHATIAFAAGYCLEAKSGLDVTLLQKSQQGVRTWKAEAGPARQGPLWQEASDVAWNPKSSAVALAVSATNQVLDDVTAYLKKSRTAVGRVVPLTAHPQPGPGAVEDGLHALQLAQDLSLKIRSRSARERGRPLHLFAAAPNAMLFFLGQLARSFGEVQLYEHDFGSGRVGAYVRSLRLGV